jgi:hypothetical protein
VNKQLVCAGLEQNQSDSESEIVTIFSGSYLDDNIGENCISNSTSEQLSVELNRGHW